MKRIFFHLLLIAFFVEFSYAQIPTPPLDQWKLEGSGSRVSETVLELTGDGKASSAWQSPTLELEPGACYRYDVTFQGVDTEGGCLPCGINGFSRDYRVDTKNTWQDKSFYFRMPDSERTPALRVGQWESSGTYQFKEIKLQSAVPLYKKTDFLIDSKPATLMLGDAEQIIGGVYKFNGRFDGHHSNIHRPLQRANCWYNTYRWCLGNGSELIYRFAIEPFSGEKPLDPIRLDTARLEIGVCYFNGEKPGIVEVSLDGKTRWSRLGLLDKEGRHEFELPAFAFPVGSLYLRVRGEGPSHFQLDSIQFEAPLEQLTDGQWANLNLNGNTLMVTGNTQAGKDLPQMSLRENGSIEILESGRKPRSIPLPPSASPGKQKLTFKAGSVEWTGFYETHPLHRSDYGYFVQADKKASVWWAEPDWKVSRDRVAAAKETAKPIEIYAAKNDVESFQVVLRAESNQPLRGIQGSVSDLIGPNNAKISASNIELLYDYYHFVHSRTDASGIVDWWPDALPPLDRPLDIPPGKNQPIRLKVKVPESAQAGLYSGKFQLKSEDGSYRIEIPYSVHVWNFALPRENHLETAYGFNPHLAMQYHNARTEADRRKILDLYWESFAEHRISVYDPTPFDHIQVKWLPDKEDGAKSKCEIDFTRYDKEMERVLAKYHFTRFTVPGHGLGGGTFQGRSNPSLVGYAEDTPEYKAMMTDYYTQLVRHLEEKGWIDKVYVYWFDEPGKHDYEFVAQGTARLQHYAPKLTRMMTLMMRDRLFLNEMEKLGTFLNVWCPVSHGYDDEMAQERMAKGERFWWYVCTGPKEPYCTLFIDHPAVELRLWHWQAWQRKIVGSLIWQTNYWTSHAGEDQDPYEDPMGYVAGDPKRSQWGNGDGRFIYPPLAARKPGGNDGKPIFEKPVSSIRWAMLREGVEDYEMFLMLKNALEAKKSKLSEAQQKEFAELLEVPKNITESLTEFTIDPRPIHQRRQAIGKAIEIVTSY